MNSSCTADTSFGGTVQSGIQDISALLPLLGTEQCEDHVGSALVDGYLYAVATPLSIFGSLGVVSSGFKVLVASFTLRLGSWYIVGAANLADIGFKTSGKAASMVLFDTGKHCYLAETKLKALLDDQHIENVEMLKVEPSYWRWNVMMCLLSIFTVTLGITPYFHLIFHDHSNLHIYLRWVYPLARVIGSSIAAIMIQLVVQNRTLQIIKTRIIFMTLENFKEAKNIAHLPDSIWSSSLSSEQCLWNLKRMGPDIDAGIQELQGQLDTELKKHFSDGNHYLQHAQLIVTQILLLLGLVSSVIGYLGCFTLVQSVNSVKGPLIWLGLEVVLSLLRMIIWGLNPAWDDSTGVNFTLTLVSNCPMVTCDKYNEELVDESVFPLVWADDFLRRIASYTGLLKRLDDKELSLYYTLTRSEQSLKRILYITTLNHREKNSKLFCIQLEEKSDQEKLMFHSASVEVDETDDTVKCIANPTNLIADLDQEKRNKTIQDHGYLILEKLQKGSMIQGAVNIMPTNWALQAIELSPDPNLSIFKNLFQSGLHFIGGIVTPRVSSEPVDEESQHNNDMLINDGNAIAAEDSASEHQVKTEDKDYLEVGKLERLKRDLSEKRGQWIAEYMKVVRKEAINDVPNNSWSNQKILLIENEFKQSLLITERGELEILYLEETTELEFHLQDRHRAMLRSLARLVARDQVPEETLAEKQGIDRTEDRMKREGLKNTINRMTTERMRMESRLKAERQDDEHGIKVSEFKYEAERRIRDKMDNLNKRIDDKWTVAINTMLWPNIDDPRLMRLEEQDKELSERLAKEEGEINRWLEYGIEEIPQSLSGTHMAEEEIFTKLEIGEMRNRCCERLKRMRERVSGERKDSKDRVERAVINLAKELEDFSSSKFIAALTISSNKYLELNPAIRTEREKIMAISRALTRNTEATLMDLTYYNLGDEDAEIIASMLKSMKRVVSINLSHNRISKTGAAALADAVRESGYIMSMDVSDNSMDDNSEEKIRGDVKQNISSRENSESHRNIPPTIFYKDVEVVDRDPKGLPYLSFQQSSSECIIMFFAHRGLAGKKLILGLNHLFKPSCEALDIRLNNKPIGQAEGYRPKDEFEVQEFTIDEFTEEQNNRVSIACKFSRPVTWWVDGYCLSNITLLPEGEKEWPRNPNSIKSPIEL